MLVHPGTNVSIFVTSISPSASSLFQNFPCPRSLDSKGCIWNLESHGLLSPQKDQVFNIFGDLATNAQIPELYHLNQLVTFAKPFQVAFIRRILEFNNPPKPIIERLFEGSQGLEEMYG